MTFKFDLLCKTFNIDRIFWMGFHISYVYSFWHNLSVGTNIFDLLTLKFYLLFKNFNIDHIFWMVSDRAFIFHMCIPFDINFLLVPNFLTSWPFTLKICILFKNFNIGHIFWLVSNRAFIFYMCIPYAKTFLLVSNFWPPDLDLLPTFRKLLSISFEW
jgi:hypothetical protein